MKNAAALSRAPVTDPVSGGSRARRGVRRGEREAAPADLSTRDRVTQLLLERGATTAAQLGSALGLSPAAIRRHLDAMLADGDVVAREQTVRGSRGRGRPAKVFALTEAGRGRCGTHHYDNMATAALRWIARTGGTEAVAAFAAEQVSALETRCRAAMEDAGDAPLARAEALAGALTAEGYAANASTIASGGQLCQHHCPVAHVAAEFPQLCEAETEVISRLVGTHVQRLATIAHGDGVCTTHIPAQSGSTVTTVRTDR
ncbi:ArsR family transcriptional regulator [Micromonospora sp. WMMD1076]|uniref:helix-turn-helix transcriptional regulator n=1 Tax=Micromonospora sp. WMMD1076 TaxID=3016103 RepID=UPI00249B085C|nr:HTH domain-containing protein [Micromonospora sp. WMMD1076]WFF06116.1 ArsR family transcriptional regulator [Micromonospora sp. WMMD1076]